MNPEPIAVQYDNPDPLASRGPPLRLKDLRALADGTVVWAYGVKFDESDNQVHTLDGPATVHLVNEGLWNIEDVERRYGMEFIRGGEGGDNDECLDKFEGGFLWLFTLERTLP